MRRRLPLLPALALAALALTACTEAELNAFLTDVLAEEPGAGATASAPGAAASAAPPGARSLDDRPDEVEGPQIHLVYAVPPNARDERLDTDGRVARSFENAQAWLKARTGGSAFRLDTYAGRPDVSYLPLPRALSLKSDEALDALILEARDKAGFNQPHKIYAVYYQGTTDEATLLGKTPYSSNHAVLFLERFRDTAGAYRFGEAATSPQDLVALHEIGHALGHVPEDAAERDAHHVAFTGDLMSPIIAESAEEMTLDPRHANYFGREGDRHDLGRSPFLAPLPAAAQLPAGQRFASRPAANAVPLKPLGAGEEPASARERAVLARFQGAARGAGRGELGTPEALTPLARHVARALQAGAGDVALPGPAESFALLGGWRYNSLSVVGGAALSPEALAERVAASGMFDKALQSGSTAPNAAGVAVLASGDDALVVLFQSHLYVTFDALALGDGPQAGLRTLSGKARLFDAGQVAGLGVSTGRSPKTPAYLGAFRSDQTLDFFCDVGGGPAATLQFWFKEPGSAPGAMSYYEAHKLAFAPDAALASALLPGPSAYRLRDAGPRRQTFRYVP